MTAITQLKAKNFKCFKDLTIDFKPLTLLTGANSSGKSSIIYGLIGPFQSENFPFEFSTNGKYTNLGDYEDIAFQHKVENNIVLQYTFDDLFKTTIHSEWQHNEQNRLPKLHSLLLESLVCKVAISKSRKYHVEIELKNNEIAKKTFDNETVNQFLSLIKSFPKDFNAKKIKKVRGNYSFKVNKLNEIDQYVFWLEDWKAMVAFRNFNNLIQSFLDNFNFIGPFRLAPERTYYEKNEVKKVNQHGDFFIDQIVDWEQNNRDQFARLVYTMSHLEMLNDVQIKRIKGGRFEMLIKMNNSHIFNPISDTGFGVSQFLPVIVADLQLDRKSTLIVSQPEIHLHPKVQSDFGIYLKDQIKDFSKSYIVETHSEYLINKIRVLVAKGELDEEEVALYYCENENGKGTKITKIDILKNGQLRNAPASYFETYASDTFELALNS